MEIKFSIIDFMGKVDNGVLVLLGAMYRGNYYEFVFYKNIDGTKILTPSISFEMDLGLKCRLKDMAFLYSDLVEKADKKVGNIDDLLADMPAFNTNTIVEELIEEIRATVNR